MNEQEEGITLQSIPYKERTRIIKIYTKKRGLLSLIVKGISTKKPSLLSLNSPFCFADFIYKSGRSDIYLLKDVTIKDKNLSLRGDLESINSAYLMVKAILDSQLPNKSAPTLYALLKKYIKNVSKFKCKDSLLISFLLKLLLHEGLLHLNSKCNICKEESTAINLGESVCKDHINPLSHIFTKEEFQNILTLSSAKAFSKLKDIETETPLKEKVLSLFKDLT